MSLMGSLIIKLVLLSYMSVFVVNKPLSTPSIIFYIGTSLNILEFIVTKGHFYTPLETTGGFYTNKASAFAKMLGDKFHFGESIYFSVGDILMGIGIIWSVIWWL